MDTTTKDTTHRPDSAAKATASVANSPRLRGVDGRTRTAQRWRALYAEFAAALGHDPSPAERELLVDAAALALDSEMLAASAARGERVDPDLRVRVSGALGRALERLGILGDGPPPDPPDPDQHLAKVRDPDYWRRKLERR